MCPPGTDQTTRGPQRWSVLAPSLEQKLSPGGPQSKWVHGWFSETPFSTSKQFKNIFEKLARRTVTPSGLQNTTADDGKELAPIEDLPAEITSLIIQDLPETDILALGACSEALWIHVLRHIEGDHRKSIAPWAGTPLVYTGTYLTALPSTLHGFYPTIKEDEADHDRRMRFPDLGRGCPANGVCPARGWNWEAISTYESAEDKSSYEKWRKALSGILKVEWKALERLHAELDKALRAPGVVAGRWFLRNLTLKKYVNLDVSVDEEPDGPQATVKDTPWLTLDMAMLMQIRWSAGEEGAWAGHCFDVVEEQPAGNEWKDVTMSVTEAASKLEAEGSHSGWGDDEDLYDE